MTDKTEREVIENRLQNICDENHGRITPELTVLDAADKDSPLHSLFEWDNAKAGHQHRLDQARQLLRSVRIVTRVDSRKVVVPYYVRDPDAGDEQGYVPLLSLKSKEQQARETAIQEFKRAASALQRAKSIAEVLNLNDDIEALIDQLRELQARV
jgi:translation initiation factor 2 alpha subunit (eIF-2alpha)